MRWGNLLILFLTGVWICNCANQAHRAGWGRHVTLLPGWQKALRAARKAATSPETLAPLAASLFVQIDNMDGRISEWASDNSPIFGSNKNADDWSNYLRDATGASYLITALAADSGNEAGQVVISKLRGIAVGAAAIGLTDGTTKLIKDIAGRTRPDGSDDKSFVSAHSSAAAGFAALSKKNLQYIAVSKTSQSLLGAGFTGLAALTGWARIEANAHYPSDVLAGYALGYFICTFVNDTFLGAGDNQEIQVEVLPSRHGTILGISWFF